MQRMKTRASRTVASSSSSSDKNISLGASQEEAPTPLAPSADVASSSDVSRRRSGMPSQRNDGPASTRHNGRTIFQCKFVKVLIFFKKNKFMKSLFN